MGPTGWLNDLGTLGAPDESSEQTDLTLPLQGLATTNSHRPFDPLLPQSVRSIHATFASFNHRNLGEVCSFQLAYQPQRSTPRCLSLEQFSDYEDFGISISARVRQRAPSTQLPDDR
jgi:hypothetical protein